jgi:hypothetical protein
MRESYLWDRSGDVDPEVEQLEQVLSQFRQSQPLRQLPARSWLYRAMLPQAILPQAIAACLLLAAAASLFAPLTPSAQETPWQVLTVDGHAALGQKPVRATARLYANQTLRTDDNSRVTLEAEAVGRIDVEPASELRVVASESSRQTLRLAYGTIHALIWAPPHQFFVDTPSSQAIDLGCQYTLSVEPSGTGLLKVEFGWVAFQSRQSEAFIPAGAVCRTSRERGPATPYFEDSSALFQDAVGAFDQSAARPCPVARQDCGDREALNQILRLARPKDAMTLWHLLVRARNGDQGAIFDRFVQLVGLPKGVTRDGALAGDPAMIDRCWNALNLMDVEFWRGWKRDWR